MKTPNDRTGFVKIFTPILEELKSKNQPVIKLAISIMCEHYRCEAKDLVLEDTSNFPDQIISKNIPGLAYLIQYYEEGDTWRIRALPIYLEETP